MGWVGKNEDLSIRACVALLLIRGSKKDQWIPLKNIPAQSAARSKAINKCPVVFFAAKYPSSAPARTSNAKYAILKVRYWEPPSPLPVTIIRLVITRNGSVPIIIAPVESRDNQPYTMGEAMVAGSAIREIKPQSWLPGVPACHKRITTGTTQRRIMIVDIAIVRKKLKEF
jgi:hypothetical protein